MIVTHIGQIGVIIAQLDARDRRLTQPYRPQVELPDSIDGFDTFTVQVIIAYVGRHEPPLPTSRAWKAREEP